MNEPVERFLSPNEDLLLTIHRRSDGCYGYSVDKFWIDDLPEYNHHMEYWAPMFHCSSIYDSAATTKREAALEFPWVLGTKPPDKDDGS